MLWWLKALLLRAALRLSGGDAAPQQFQPAVPDCRASGPGEAKPRPPPGARCWLLFAPQPAAQLGAGAVSGTLWGAALP